ncbi:MAG TPA: VOC family protein [Polyangiales bacterium]|nr:VOC family protein [Polyangiales bacterium]
MIKGLDHVAIAVEDFDAAVEQYRLLLGIHASDACGVPGQRAALFALSNSRILLLEADTRLDGVEALGLAVADGEQLTAAEVHSHPAQIGGAKLWALPHDETRALTLRLVARADAALPAAASFATNSVDALDHVVIRSAAPDDAVALYNGALGIRLALDKVLGGVRMLFFRTGGVTIELIADASASAADSFYGLAYRVRDLAAAHARLTAAGFVLTEPRVGRKSGTHVFSVRSSTCGVPTLFIRDASRD